MYDLSGRARGLYCISIADSESNTTSTVRVVKN